MDINQENPIYQLEETVVNKKISEEQTLKVVWKPEILCGSNYREL